jgi:hypothetical protein
LKSKTGKSKKTPDLSGRGIIPMQGDRFHGSTCSRCVDFKACKKKKGRIDDCDYCHVPGKRFRDKREV